MRADRREPMTAPEARECVHGDVRLEYLAWPGGVELAPALLVPGMAAAASDWLDVAAFVEGVRARGRRRVLAVSLRGRGGSSCPEAAWGPEEHQGDIGAVLAAEAIARCHLIGHSVGGVHALGFALARPDAVASVTVGDHPPRLRAYGPDWVARLEAWEERRFHPLFPRRVAAESRALDYAGHLAALHAPLLVVRGTGPGSLLTEADLASFGRAPRLEVVEVPGGHDVFAAPDAAGACARFLEGADARLGGS